MKKLMILVLSLAFFASCTKKSTTVDAQKTTTELLMGNPWKLDRYTNTANKTLSNSEVGSQAIALYSMNFEFRTNNKTYAIERTTKQVINAGTWYLTDNDKTIDIAVIGFGGKFKVVEITKSKLVLQTDTNNLLVGVGNVVNLEFSAVL